MRYFKPTLVGCGVYTGITLGLLLNPRQVREDPRPVPPGSYVVRMTIPETPVKPVPAQDRKVEGTAF